MNKKSIFQQLLVKIMLRVVVVLIGHAFFNITKSDDYVKQHFDVVNKIYVDQVQTFLEFQDRTLQMIEVHLNQAIELWSYQLINEDFLVTDGISDVDLDVIRNKLHINPSDIDVHIVNRKGYIVNTTFSSSLGKTESTNN